MHTFSRLMNLVIFIVEIVALITGQKDAFIALTLFILPILVQIMLIALKLKLYDFISKENDYQINSQQTRVLTKFNKRFHEAQI